VEITESMAARTSRGPRRNAIFRVQGGQRDNWETPLAVAERRDAVAKLKRALDARERELAARRAQREVAAVGLALERAVDQRLQPVEGTARLLQPAAQNKAINQHAQR
jgi:hypothetical protein